MQSLHLINTIIILDEPLCIHSGYRVSHDATSGEIRIMLTLETRAVSEHYMTYTEVLFL